MWLFFTLTDLGRNIFPVNSVGSGLKGKLSTKEKYTANAEVITEDECICVF